MADISQISIGGTTYPLKDGTARSNISNIQSQIGNHTLAENVPSGAVFTDTTYSAATTTDAGLMSATDKTKLDGIATGANAYTHPTHTAATSGFYKVTIDSEGHVTAVTPVTQADITGLSIATNSVATTSANGLMSSTDKTILDNLKTSYDNLIDDAPAAYDTLKEIGDYISTHQDEYEALATLAGVQSDWGETDPTEKAYIANKPDAPSFATVSGVNVVKLN